MQALQKGHKNPYRLESVQGFQSRFLHLNTRMTLFPLQLSHMSGLDPSARMGPLTPLCPLTLRPFSLSRPWALWPWATCAWCPVPTPSSQCQPRRRPERLSGQTGVQQARLQALPPGCSQQAEWSAEGRMSLWEVCGRGIFRVGEGGGYF